MPDRSRGRMLAGLASLALLTLALAPTFGPALDPPIEFEDAFFYNPYPTTPWLNALLAIAVLAHRRRAILDACAAGRARPVGGAALLAVGLAFQAWSHFTASADLAVPAVLVVCAGLALAVGGGPLLRATGAALPLLALTWPLPPALMNALIPALQTLARDGAALLVSPFLSGVSTTGDVLRHGATDFHVIESCSGTRGLWTLQLAALSYGELLALPVRRRIGLCLAAIPIALVLNAGRIAVIVLAGSMVADDHTTQGLVATVIGVVCLYLVDVATDRRADGRTEASTESGPEHTPRLAPILFVAATALALLTLPRITPRWDAPDSPAAWPFELPTRTGEWSARRRYLDPNFLGSIGYSQIVKREYYEGPVEASPSVRILVAHHDRVQRRTSLLSPRWRRASARFDEVERGTRFVAALDRDVTTSVNEGSGERRLVWSGSLGTSGVVEEILRGVSGVDRSPWRPPEGITAFRFETTIPPGVDGLTRANRLLERFVDEVGRSIVGGRSGIGEQAGRRGLPPPADRRVRDRSDTVARRATPPRGDP